MRIKGLHAVMDQDSFIVSFCYIRKLFLPPHQTCIHTDYENQNPVLAASFNFDFGVFSRGDQTLSRKSAGFRNLELVRKRNHAFSQ